MPTRRIMLFITSYLLAFLFLLSCSNTAPKTTINTPPLAPIIQKPFIESVATTLSQIETIFGKVKRVTHSTFLAQMKNHKIEKVALGNKYITTYDSHGNGIEKRYYNSTNKLQTNTVYTSNAQGICTDAKVLQASGRCIKMIHYNYNGLHYLHKTITTTPASAKAQRTNYVFNANQQLIEEIDSSTAITRDGKITYIYNPKFNLVETDFYDTSNKLNISCHYEILKMDAQKNWVLRITRSNKGALLLEERLLEYY